MSFISISARICTVILQQFGAYLRSDCISILARICTVIASDFRCAAGRRRDSYIARVVTRYSVDMMYFTCVALSVRQISAALQLSLGVSSHRSGRRDRRSRGCYRHYADEYFRRNSKLCLLVILGFSIYCCARLINWILCMSCVSPAGLMMLQ